MISIILDSFKIKSNKDFFEVFNQESYIKARLKLIDLLENKKNKYD